MIYFLFLFNQFLLISGQVVLTCSRQSDCYIGDYCDETSMCYACWYVDPGSCDSIDQNCCSQAFLKQCINNPFKCVIDNNNKPIISKKEYSNIYLYVFLYAFLIGGAFYISFGMYYNQYVKQKKGIEIVPNINFWREVYGLVSDGIYFTIFKIKDRQYNSLE